MNNRTFLITVLLLTSLSGFCQIGTTDVAAPAAPKQKEEVAVFDSTKNYLGEENVFSYEGQILFVLPRPKRFEQYGFYDFVPAKSNSSPYYQTSSIAYEKLKEKYFYVEKVSEHTEYSQKKYVLYLTEKDNPSNQYWYYYNPHNEHSFPFFVVSHFNYLKNRYIGKKFIIARNYLKSHDIVTGDTIIIPNEAKMFWTATDITIVNDDNRKLHVIVKSGNLASCVSLDWFEDAITQDDQRRVFEKSEWDNLVATYGFSMMQSVLSAKIKVGMPIKLLIMSWGKPDRINSASYGDQYVYGNDCVYLKGGKITSWN
jgi:hypothetical protein